MKRRTLALLCAALFGVPGAAHLAVRSVSHFEPPTVRVPPLPLGDQGGVRRAGLSSVRQVGKLLEVRLFGTPEAIGAAHAELLGAEMRETEGAVWELLDQKVPNALAQLFLLDAGQLAYRNVGGGIAGERRREIAASAAAFRPDPFGDRFDTFQRFVYLTALYDISLAYEHSPLVGCTTFSFSGSATEHGPILARAFDFDAHDVYDERKAVFLVFEDGKIPFASVAWPGLVGVVSGMNREGVAAVVHGARAGAVRTVGEPVIHELRRVLSTATTTDDALRALGATEPLVSHIVILSDSAGHAVVAERVPGAPLFSRALGERDAVTNHLEGPFATDPKNQRVRETTSTLPRAARGNELARAVSRATPAVAVQLLRDRLGAGGTPLPLGDRRAIDALIATHAVVFETAERRLWVSEAPHSLGRFVSFDLQALLDPALPVDVDPEHGAIPEDPLLTSGEYDKLARRGGDGRERP